MILQIWISPISPPPLNYSRSIQNEFRFHGTPSVHLSSTVSFNDEGVTSTSKSSDPTDRGVPHDRGDSSTVSSKDREVAFRPPSRTSDKTNTSFYGHYSFVPSQEKKRVHSPTTLNLFPKPTPTWTCCCCYCCSCFLFLMFITHQHWSSISPSSKYQPCYSHIGASSIFSIEFHDRRRLHFDSYRSIDSQRIVAFPTNRHPSVCTHYRTKNQKYLPIFFFFLCDADLLLTFAVTTIWR